MDPFDEAIREVQDLVEDLPEMALQALGVLIASAINELRVKVDEGRADPELLRGIAEHAAEQARLVPFTLRQ